MKNLFNLVVGMVSGLTGKTWKGAKSKLGYTFLTIAVEIVLAQTRAAHPEWTLPSADQVLAFGALLVGCHTVTDFVSALSDGLAAYQQTKKAK